MKGVMFLTALLVQCAALVPGGICRAEETVDSLALQAGPQAPAGQERELSLKVAFRQGRREIDPKYMNNAANIASFTSALRYIAYDSSIDVLSVDIIGGASIEGPADLNWDLSNNRANRMVEILRQCTDVPPYLVHVDSRGVNWEDVIEMVEADPMVPSRDRVLDILRNAPEPERRDSLQNLEGSVPYDYMYRNIYPYVRTGKMTVRFRTYPKWPQAPQVVRDTIYHIIRDESGTPRNVNQNIMNVSAGGAGRQGRPGDAPLSAVDRLDTLLRTPVIAFRSNLLIPLMNVGVEIPLGNRWSLSADWYYPWAWRRPDHKDCFEFLGGTAEVRYWFGWRHAPGESLKKYRLLGHSIGLVVSGGYYDFQKDWAGFQGEFGAAGIDYQYAVPLGKKGGVHMEFDITLGVITSRNIPYDVFSSGGILLHRDGLVNGFSWIGPIKAGVSLVVPIFRKEKAGQGEAGTSNKEASL